MRFHRLGWLTHILGSAVVLSLLTACGGGGGGGGSGQGGNPLGDLGSCSYRVDGYTIDKVDVQAYALLDGSTLNVSCAEMKVGSTKLSFVLDLKAFDGPGQYEIDNTKTAGDATYYGNDNFQYYNESQDATAGCDVTITAAPAAPKEGDHIVGTFQCNGLEGYVAQGDWEYVNVTNGTFTAVYSPL
jgi:hypothetical protein